MANKAARYIRNSKGVSGTNIEYLINTITYLEELDINASQYKDLLELVNSQ
jgi:cation transport regulator ChaC